MITWAIIHQESQKICKQPTDFPTNQVISRLSVQIMNSYICFFSCSLFPFTKIFIVVSNNNFKNWNLLSKVLHLKDLNHCLQVLQPLTRHPVLNWKHQKPEKRCEYHNSQSRLYHYIIICRIPLPLSFYDAIGKQSQSCQKTQAFWGIRILK